MQTPPHTEATQVLEGFTFEDGTRLDLEIAYWTMGELNADGSNVLLLSHGASSARDWAFPFCREGGAFDPAGRFVVSIDLPGGGDSSRLSRTPGFPRSYTLHDLTRALSALLDKLGARRNVLFAGVSVSTLIGLDLAATRPDLLGGAALWNCGARCDGFANAVTVAIASILSLDGGPAGMKAAVDSFYPVLTGRSLLAALGASEREQVTACIAQGWTDRWRADELSARYTGAISTGDVIAIHGGERALAAKLTCPILFLPSSSDQILPAADIARFAERLPSARVLVCETDRGHQSSSAPQGTPEFAFYDGHTSDFFRSLG